jgi:hypothetical protein
MSNGHPLTPERKTAFIAELARHGIAHRAARAASPGSSPTGATTIFTEARDRDPAFAAAWEDALEVARADFEHEIYRRSTEGYEEPVYGGQYKETVVGTVRKYSDRLLELRARALLPAYRAAAALNVNKRVTYDVDVGLLGDAVTSVAMRLVGTFRPPELTVIEGRSSDDA